MLYQLGSLIQPVGLYPNPFTDKSVLMFNLRVQAQVEVTIFNVAGEVVDGFVVNGQASPPVNSAVWEGINRFGARCASGIYPVHVKAHGVDGTNGDYWVTLACVR